MKQPVSQSDLDEMIAYQGPSTRKEQAAEGWVGTLDVADSDENERLVDPLLSAAGISFYLKRATGWKGTQKYMTILVAPNDLVRVESLLRNAQNEGFIQFVEHP